jgi:hypothetical protein
MKDVSDWPQRPLQILDVVSDLRPVPLLQLLGLFWHARRKDIVGHQEQLSLSHELVCFWPGHLTQRQNSSPNKRLRPYYQGLTMGTGGNLNFGL